MLTLVFAAACVDWGAPDVETDAYKIARRGWEEQGPAAYEYTLQRTCACSAERMQAVLITVRDGTVADRRYVSSGVAVPAAEAPFFPTIDALFDELQQLLDDRPSSHEVYYNGAWGYPFLVNVVPNTTSAQGQVGWQISSWRQI